MVRHLKVEVQLAGRVRVDVQRLVAHANTLTLVGAGRLRVVQRSTGMELAVWIHEDPVRVDVVRSDLNHRVAVGIHVQVLHVAVQISKSGFHCLRKRIILR